MRLQFGIIIVTHNSHEVIETCISFIEEQSREADQIIVIDSGSSDTDYLDFLRGKKHVQLHLKNNIGFSQANNAGIQYVNRDADVVVFINPDTFLKPDFLSKAESLFLLNHHIQFLSGKLLGYDLRNQQPSGKIDSCGIFRKWYGRWFDRGQGQVDRGQYSELESVPALCGACICCRKSVIDRYSGSFFDPDFFLYKEDIELGLRLHKSGIDSYYSPDLEAYHCRGWNVSRKEISLLTKKQAAENEILLYKKHPSPYIIWALFKYFLVTFFKV